MIAPFRILSQHGLGACVGYGLAGACEALLRQELSPEWAWSLARIKQGTYPKDVGVSLAVALAECARVGMARDADHDLEQDPRTVTAATLPLDYRAIPKDATWGRPSVAAIKNAIDHGRPVVFSSKITEEWMNLEGPLEQQRYRGRLRPTYTLAGTAEQGGQHTQWICGYSRNGLHVVNSYGVGWGDNGIGLLPIDVAANDIYMAFEIIRIGDINMDDDLLEVALKPYMGQPIAFGNFMNGVRISSPGWATFYRYLARREMTAENALEFCKLLGFDRVSQLAEWVDSA